MAVIKIIRIILAVIFVLITVLLIPQVKFDNSIKRWIPPSSSGVLVYEEFLKQFGGDALLVVAFHDPHGFKRQDTKDYMNNFQKKVQSLPYVNNVFKMPFPLFRLKIKPGDEIYSVVITFNPPSHLNPNRLDLLKKIENLLEDIPLEYHIAGTGVLHRSINEETKRSTFFHFSLGLFLLFSLLVFILNRPIAFLMTIGASLGGVCSLLIFSALLHIPLSMMSIILPVLILFYCTSSSLHVFFHHGNFKKVLVPCLMAALTTSIGFLVFLIASIQLLRDFALLAVSGIMGGLLWALLLFFPQTLSYRPRNHLLELFHRSPIPSKARYLLLSLCLVVVMIPGIKNVRVDMFPLAFVSSSNQGVLDYQFIEKNVGNFIPLEYIVEVGKVKPDDLNQWISMVFKLDEVGGVLSYLEFLPQLNPQQYGYISKSGNLGRITFLIPLLSSTKGIALGKKIDLLGDKYIGHHIPKATGYITLFAYVADELGKSFLRSLILVFLLVFFVIFVYLRDIKLFLSSLFPTIFPILIIIGMMGWLKISLDIVTIPIGCLFLSIIADDTIHFLYWYQKSRDLKITMAEAGPGIYLTSFVLVLGFSLFILSPSPPVRNFGILGVIALTTALFGVVVLLPIILKITDKRMKPLT